MDNIEIRVGEGAARLTPVIVEGELRPAVVVVPGGGYDHVSEREAEPVARAWVARGFQAFVLRYSVAPARYPQALEELAAAVALLRARSGELGIASGRVAVCGFSAGGHLAGCLGALWWESWLSEAVGATSEDIRPDALVLGYPVITSGEYGHARSFRVLTGGDARLTDELSLERRVDAGFPPTFLWHTAEDQSVPAENSLLMAGALLRAGVELSLHVFPHGPHGIALATEETALNGRADHVQPLAQVWPDLAASWLATVL